VLVTVAVNGSCQPAQYDFKIIGANGPVSDSTYLHVKVKNQYCRFFDFANNVLAHQIVIDKKNFIWCAGGAQLDLFDRSTWTTYTSSNSQLPSGYIYGMIEDTSAGVWLASELGGVSHFDGTFWTIYNHTNSGLLSDCAQDLAFDNSGNLWVAAKNDIGNTNLGGGLYKFDGLNWTRFDSTNTPLTNNNVSSVSIDHNGVIWIVDDADVGSNVECILTYNGTNWTRYTYQNSCLPDANRIGKIHFDSQNNAWFALAYNNGSSPDNRCGIMKINNTEWEIWNDSAVTPYNHRVYTPGCTIINQDNSSRIHSPSVRDLYIDNSDQIYMKAELTSSGSGLIRFIEASNTWQQYTKTNSLLFENAIEGITSTIDTLWLCSRQDYIFGPPRIQYFTCADSIIISDVDQVNFNAVNFFPNPASQKLIIMCSDRECMNSLIEFFDFEGKKIASRQLINEQNEIDVSKWANGIYFYSMTINNNSIRGKIVIVK